jgi:hypothetical protein
MRSMQVWLNRQRDRPHLELWLSLAWGQPHFWGTQMGSLEWTCLPGTLRDGCKGLWRWGVSLCGGSVKGTWREGSLAGVPGGWVERALETGVCFRRTLLGNLEEGSSNGNFGRWM